MRFNLWYETECEESDVDVGALLRWLGDLKFENDVLVNIVVEEAVK